MEEQIKNKKIYPFVKAPLTERKEDCLKRIARYKEGLDPNNYKKILGFENIVESKIEKLSISSRYSNPLSPEKGFLYDISDYKELLSLETEYLSNLLKEEELTRGIN
jgi:hypothetical protein